MQQNSRDEIDARTVDWYIEGELRAKESGKMDSRRLKGMRVNGAEFVNDASVEKKYRLVAY